MVRRAPAGRIALCGVLLLLGAMRGFGGDAGGKDEVTVTSRPGVESQIADADGHYARRHEGHVGSRAAPREIEEAVAGYERAASDPGNAEAQWKLARALYFLGTYTGLDPAARHAVFERARRAGEDAIEAIFRRHGSAATPRDLDPAAAAALTRGDRDAPAAFFWAAVGWGQWALTSGRLDAVRHGAADRIRDLSETVIRLDPSFEEGGGYRILGRLHDRAPKIPLITGWVSRDEALRDLRLAAAAGPANLVNRQFLAEALEQRGDRAGARRLEAEIAAAQPSASHLVEELAIQETAKRNLEGWKGTVEGER
jgi:tetratricopeptide (TPR) repeat protein